MVLRPFKMQEIDHCWCHFHSYISL